MSLIQLVDIDSLIPDPDNPRKADQARLALLALSVKKLGFITPIYPNKYRMVLSGHQRLHVARELKIEKVPVVFADVPKSAGVNILFNRSTNDMTAIDTGTAAFKKMPISDIVSMAEGMSDCNRWPCLDMQDVDISDVGRDLVHLSNQRAIKAANNLYKYGIKVPLVLSESGTLVNGVYRLLGAKTLGIKRWPVVTIPDEHAEIAAHMLNFLSMDFSASDEFADLLRASSYRRPQNSRGTLPKGMRFWADEERTLPNSKSYGKEFWRRFKEIHGRSILDFGAGLCNTRLALEDHDIGCDQFEPYILPSADSNEPDREYSIARARVFLGSVASGKKYTSIFLSSVMNSVPFPKDRLMVLAVVHALCDKETSVYATCRDIRDFNYEYSGFRVCNYFRFDSEPGVRVGDVMSKPKIQKFHTQSEALNMFSRFWGDVKMWEGANVFFVRCCNPKGINTNALLESLAFEFNLPYKDGHRMGLVEEATNAFARRLGLKASSK